MTNDRSDLYVLSVDSVKNGNCRDAITPVDDRVVFKDLDNMHESKVEDMLRVNPGLIAGLIEEDDESGDGELLIVGQQVRNMNGKRSDLTALDQAGNIVLIEIKRDAVDMAGRSEQLEFQAIRYAATCATIRSLADLADNVFAGYVHAHRAEFNSQESLSDENLSDNEVARRILGDFAQRNGILEEDFNEKQRIVLVASGFDSETLSAVSWLNANGVYVACLQMEMFRMQGDDDVLLDMRKILPLPEYADLYVRINDGQERLTKTRAQDRRERQKRHYGVDIMDFLEAGAKLRIKSSSNNEQAELQDNGDVKVTRSNNFTMVGMLVSRNQWVTTILERSANAWTEIECCDENDRDQQGNPRWKTLDAMRADYLRRRDAGEDDETADGAQDMADPEQSDCPNEASDENSKPQNF